MDSAALCPSCESEGRAGQACRERGCSKRGYHCIPVPYAERLLAKSAPQRDAQIGAMVGKYLLVDVLGAGGFGKVYLALQMPIGLHAALKLMHTDRLDGAKADMLLRRFEGEAKALARLSHPNIVRLLEYGHYGDAPYLVMEFVEGARTFKSEVRDKALRGEEIEPHVVRHIFEQLLDALDAAHRASVIHRDLKPDNIMLLSLPNDGSFVKVVDFGLAKLVEARTETSAAMGTPMYMAPEQVTLRHIGPWTDLYAVGVMAFELMTGLRPYPGRTSQEILALKLNPKTDVAARLVDLDVPASAIAFFRRALALDTTERYQDAASMRRAIGDVFDEMQGPQTTSVSVDLSGLLDQSDLQKLAAERKKLESEKATIAAEWEKLKNAKAKAAAETAPASEPMETLVVVPRPVGELPPPERMSHQTAADVGPEGPRTGDAVPEATARGTASWPWRGAAGIAAGAISLAIVVVVALRTGRSADGTSSVEATAGQPTAVPSPAVARPSEKPPEAMGARGLSVTPTASVPTSVVASAIDTTNATVPPGMVAVPAADYPIGCRDGDDGCFDDEKPSRLVRVGAFALMSREVTVEEYAACVAAGKCPASRNGAECNGKDRATHPVNCVSWKAASSYCGWKGWRLPTEVEWEAAARGRDGRAWPWGSETPTCRRTAAGGFKADGCAHNSTTPVGTHPEDRSSLSVLDLAGNVREWVADDYAAYPAGQADQTSRGKVNRGGSWKMKLAGFATAHTRGVDDPETQRPDLGFRCAGGGL